MQSSRFGSINPRAAGSVTSRGQCSWVSRACYETRRQSSSLPRLASSLARGYVYDVRRLQRMKTSDNLDKRGSASSLDELTEFRRRDVKAGVLRARSSPSSPGDSGRTDVGIRDPVQRACECVNSLRSTTNLQQKKKGRLEWLPSLTATALMSAAALCVLCLPGSALALEIRTEPANALSLPTWAIHVSSVLEWVTAMVLFWRLAEASGNERWKGMTWGMMPLLGGALSACTYHFFYNSPDLDFLVVLQAALTVAGNFTLWLAAYRIYTAAQQATE